MIKFDSGTTLKQFWAGLPEGAEELISELEVDGRAGERIYEVPGVGKVGMWIDDDSEGMSYTRFAELYGVPDPDGRPVVLEDDDDEGWLFKGRRTTL